MKQFGWQVVGCSMPSMQRQERHGHQVLIAALTGQQASFVVVEERMVVDYVHIIYTFDTYVREKRHGRC